MRFVMSAAEQSRRELAALNEKPPAQIQPAAIKKDWRYYEHVISASEEMTGKLYEEYRDGKAWKEQYKTWEDACVPLGKSRRQVDRIIAKDNQKRTQCPNTEADQEQKALSQVEQVREEEPEKPWVRTADEVIAANVPNPRQKVAPKEPVKRTEPEKYEHPVELSSWAKKVLDLFKTIPLNQMHRKLNPEAIKTFQDSTNSMYSVLGDFLEHEKARTLCKCGCGLSAEVSERLFAVGVPCMGLTTGQAGLIMKKMSENEWKLPRYFEFLKNSGEWKERQWRK